MKSIETVYKKCEKTIDSCKNAIQLESGYKLVEQFKYFYKDKKNYDTYVSLLTATLHIKSKELK